MPISFRKRLECEQTHGKASKKELFKSLHYILIVNRLFVTCVRSI
jgi:hypothetical protein